MQTQQKTRPIQNNPKISVILPFFNAEDTLKRAIRSITNQTYQDFECILINNNSTDNSPSIASSLAKEDSRIKIIEESEQGIVFASNSGFQQAKGEFIARMDADDEALPERLKLQAEFLEKHPEFVAVGGLVEYKSDFHSFRGFKKYVDWVNSVISYEQIKTNRFIDSPIVNPSAMWRRETGEQHGMYKNGDFPEDYEMWLRWLEAGVKISKVPKYVLKWHDSKKRLTRNHSIYSDDAFYQIKTFYLYRWLEKNNPFHPHVTIWGASKISRKRAQLLKKYGIIIDAYIDTKNTRQIGKPLYHYKKIDEAGKYFILVYVRQWYAKEQIKNFLQTRKYKEGEHFLFVS